MLIQRDHLANVTSLDARALEAGAPRVLPADGDRVSATAGRLSTLAHGHDQTSKHNEEAERHVEPGVPPGEGLSLSSA